MHFTVNILPLKYCCVSRSITASSVWTLLTFLTLNNTALNNKLSWVALTSSTLYIYKFFINEFCYTFFTISYFYYSTFQVYLETFVGFRFRSYFIIHAYLSVSFKLVDGWMFSFFVVVLNKRRKRNNKNRKLYSAYCIFKAVLTSFNGVPYLNLI